MLQYKADLHSHLWKILQFTVPCIKTTTSHLYPYIPQPTFTHTHPSVALSLYVPVQKLSESYFTIGLLLRSIVHLLITDMTLIYGSSLVKLKRRNECKMKQKFSF